VSTKWNYKEETNIVYGTAWRKLKHMKEGQYNELRETEQSQRESSLSLGK